MNLQWHKNTLASLYIFQEKERRKKCLPVNPSAFGILVVIVLKILTSTRKTVTRSVILPGTISGGTRKLIHDTITNIPEGR